MKRTELSIFSTFGFVISSSGHLSMTPMLKCPTLQILKNHANSLARKMVLEELAFH